MLPGVVRLTGCHAKSRTSSLSVCDLCLFEGLAVAMFRASSFEVQGWGGASKVGLATAGILKSLQEDSLPLGSATGTSAKDKSLPSLIMFPCTIQCFVSQDIPLDYRTMIYYLRIYIYMAVACDAAELHPTLTHSISSKVPGDPRKIPR